MKLDNCQLILVDDLKRQIKKSLEEGKNKDLIRQECIELAKNHWLVTKQRDKDEAIGAALYLYLANDKEKELLRKASEIASEIASGNY